MACEVSHVAMFVVHEEEKAFSEDLPGWLWWPLVLCGRLCCWGGGSGVQYNVMGGLWLVASCAGLLVVRRSLVRFPNCHECPVASGLGTLTSRRPDSGAFVGCLPYWVAFGGLSHIVPLLVGYILWWVYLMVGYILCWAACGVEEA